MNAEIGNYIANLAIEDGGSFVRVHPITHLTQIRCRENILRELQNNAYIQKLFDMNVQRISRWWWSIAFVDKRMED